MNAKNLLFTLPLLGLMAMGPQLAAPALHGDDTLRTIGNSSFKSGEYLKYRIHYGIINAGIAELQVNGIKEKQGRKVYHTVATGRSVGMAEWFFKTRDRYESYIDTQAMVPWEFIRDVNEGGHTINRHVIFDHYNHLAVDRKHKEPGKQFNIARNAQDLLSSFYYARTFDHTALKKGDVIPIDMFLDHEMFSFQLKFLGRERIKTDFGKINALRFRPMVQSGRVFKDNESMEIWVSDDSNKVPLLLKTDLVIGSIKMELTDYRNLVKPLRFEK